GAEKTESFQSKILVPKGLRTSLAISTSVGDVYTMVSCGSFEQPWTMQEVVEIAKTQVNRIVSARGASGL
ncbi:MAG: hypothetical protein ABSA22_10835, partial [Acidimicrobiales bacterium]